MDYPEISKPAIGKMPVKPNLENDSKLGVHFDWTVMETELGIKSMEELNLAHLAIDRPSGGLIYLPFDPKQFGRDEVEMNCIGALSGMDGIVSVLNDRRQALGMQGPPLTVSSKLAKLVYDRVHQAYDGTYDAAKDRYMGYRTTFFEADELVGLAQRIEEERQ